MEAEKILYLNVIIQAIEDLVEDKPIGSRRKADATRIKKEAEAWFKRNSADFKEVCENAGINSWKLRKAVLMSKPSALQGLLNEFRKSV